MISMQLTQGNAAQKEFRQMFPTQLGSIRNADSLGEAVRCFFDILEPHNDHIVDVKKRVQQVYQFETPERPVFHFNVTGFKYERSKWVQSELDGFLDKQIQGLVFKLKNMPESDFVPMLSTGIGRSDLIPRMFGVTFDYPPDGSVIQHFNLIEELPRDLGKLEDINVSETEEWHYVVERVRFLAEVTEGRIEIAYPQMQGPLTNAPRLMDHEDMLIACHTDPESMSILANVWADVATRLVLELRRAVGNIAGDPDLLRPRGRFYQPAWVRGLIVGDYLVLISPELYHHICAEAWNTVCSRLGPIFYHTCGPVWRSLDVMKELPGLVGFECTYVRGQTGTTADLMAVKERLEDSEIVLHHFEWPLGGPIEDPENLTAGWLREMSAGGGFIIQCSGTAEEGHALFRKLELI